MVVEFAVWCLYCESILVDGLIRILLWVLFTLALFAFNCGLVFSDGG